MRCLKLVTRGEQNTATAVSVKFGELMILTRIIHVNGIAKVRRVLETLSDNEVVAQAQAEDSERAVHRVQEKADSERRAKGKQDRREAEEVKRLKRKSKGRAVRLERQEQERARAEAAGEVNPEQVPHGKGRIPRLSGQHRGLVGQQVQ